MIDIDTVEMVVVVLMGLVPAGLLVFVMVYAFRQGPK
jgi:hypothetical protein